MWPGRAATMTALGAAALAVVAAGCGSTPTGPRPRVTRSTVGTSSTARGSATRTSTTVAATTSAWVTKATIGLPGVVDALVGSPQAVYALVVHASAGKPASGSSATVARLALGSRTPVYSREIAGASSLAYSAGSVWVAAVTSSPSAGHDGTATLDQIDPATLTPRGTMQLPITALPGGGAGFPAVLAAAPGGPLWVGIGTQLYRVDPTTGAVTGQLGEPGDVDSLSLSPDSGLLYAGTAGANGTGGVVVERDATSGALLATRDLPYSVAGAQVSASDAGVWASYRTGMLGDTVELRSSDLAQIVPPKGVTPTLRTPFVAAMGVATSVSGGVLWLYGIQTLRCANPVTGHVRSTEPVHTGVEGQVAAYPGAVYVSSSNGITVLAPPSACRVGG